MSLTFPMYLSRELPPAKVFYYDDIFIVDRQTVIKDAITTVYVAAQYFCVRIIKKL